MKTDELENELRKLKFTHLNESELEAYCNQELDQIGSGRVEAHVKLCFICERQLELLREENAALSQRVITTEDVAFVESLMKQTGGLVEEPSIEKPAATARELPLQERLAEYLRRMVLNWQAEFAQVRRGDQGEEVWSWQSEDGKLQASAIMEKNADMTIHFSSNEMELDGARVNVRLDKLSQEITLQRVSESEVAAQVAVPWEYRQGNMADISIEIV
ncbi:MAG: hypothetical protein AABO41_07400 [Acidobacteriota bacterium]